MYPTTADIISSAIKVSLDFLTSGHRLSQGVNRLSQGVKEQKESFKAVAELEKE